MNDTAAPPVRGPAQAVPARQDRDGRPCPPWCTSSHERRWDGHSGGTARIDVPGKSVLSDAFLVRAVQIEIEGEQPEVAVSALRYGREDADPALWVAVRDAEGLTGIVEMLAKATPAQHRELAAAIRKAAADITGAQAATMASRNGRQ